MSVVAAAVAVEKIAEDSDEKAGKDRENNIRETVEKNVRHVRDADERW